MAASTEAQRCIEIIQRRTPMTANEALLLRVIENEIRIEFGLDGAVPPKELFEKKSEPPEAWFW